MAWHTNPIPDIELLAQFPRDGLCPKGYRRRKASADRELCVFSELLGQPTFGRFINNFNKMDNKRKIKRIIVHEKNWAEELTLKRLLKKGWKIESSNSHVGHRSALGLLSIGLLAKKKGYTEYILVKEG